MTIGGREFAVDADGNATIATGGESIDTGEGTLVITGIRGGKVSYTYTLKENQTHESIQGNNMLKDEIAIIRELVKEFPVTGICLGHQLIGHALGGTTAKLKFGHHGCNHPVKDLGTGRIEISSQNHGFHVVLDGLDDVEATHINLNDQTLEGLRHKTLPVMSVQYHPEAAAGPHDGRYLFERFHEMMKAALA